jgi:hypothetical protein|nr:hypothetical protein [Neorhizobium tomejilense]
MPDTEKNEVSETPNGAEVTTDKAKEIAKELVGANEWKSSKLGYMTGISAISNVVMGFVGGIAQGAGRIALTWSLITKSDDLPSLPEVDPSTFDGRERFKEAMALHRRKESDIVRARINTRRSFYLYAGIAVFAVLYLIYGLSARDNIALTTLALHIAPIPLFGALAFKAGFYNWMFRHRTLDGPSVFISSRDWLPSA